jgi:hypothetical protein
MRWHDDVMTHLCCRRIAHPAYFPNLGICDFCLFGRIKEWLAGVMIVDTNDLRNEEISILARISDDEKSRVFDDWMARLE